MQARVFRSVSMHLSRRGRDLIAGTLQSLPISSRVLGPPKRFYRSFQEYARGSSDPLAREWQVLPPESQRLNLPVTVDPEAVQMFQPLNYQSPGFGLYRIQHGRFHRDARAILTKDDCLLASFSAWMGNGPQDNWLFKKVRLGSLRRVPGKSLLLVGNRNYYHFLIEEIPRVRLASQAGFLLDDFDHVLMYSPVHASQRIVCDRLGIEREKIIPLESTSHVECAELYFTTGPWNYGRTFALMAREFLLSLHHPVKTTNKRRIYISRERCSHGKITNEDQLLQKLVELGFVKIIPEILSFDEQVVLFQEAECIVGAHGAGLTNSIFASSQCRLIEIRNPTYDRNETYQARGGNIFWRFSQFVGFDYRAFFAVPDDTGCRAPDGAIVESVRLPNLTIDVGAFSSFLERILE
jgi:glycosyl transferase family 61